MSTSNNNLYVGLDFSTQQVHSPLLFQVFFFQLKCVLIDDALNVVHSCAVNFSTELSSFGFVFPNSFDCCNLLFRTENGIIRHSDGVTITSPSLLWVAAFDRLLNKLKLSSTIDLQSIKAISGCGQVVCILIIVSFHWTHFSNTALYIGNRIRVAFLEVLIPMQHSNRN